VTDISLGVAFLAGVLSFLSPCVLPLIPAYISFLSGISLEDLRQGTAPKKVLIRAGLASVFFVAGFSLVFIVLGASASFIGKLLADHITVFTRIAGIAIIVLGLYLLGVIKMDWLGYERRLKVKKFSPGFIGAFLIGLAFAFGWTPCVGPILAGILALAAAQQTLVKGMYLLAAYSLGLGIPFIITGFGVGAFMKFFEKYKKFIRWGEIIAGVLLVALGALIFFNNLNVLISFIPPAFYDFAK
jgi:cytochrome c-type biogenesis protein